MSSYNLDIETYTFQELLNLYDIPDIQHLNSTTLNLARKKCMTIHPDKSHLPGEYFIFYKRAYDRIQSMFETHCKEERSVPIHNIDYHVDDIDAPSTIIAETTKTNNENFQQKFNALFEQHIQKPGGKITHTNDWFTDTSEPKIPLPVDVKSTNDISKALQSFRQSSESLAMIQFQEIAPSFTGSQLFDSHNNTNDSFHGYITCDPFSKLKYDDLRRVHKDQPILPVSEHDFRGNRYSSADELSKARSQQILNPLEKAAAEKILDEAEKVKKHDYFRNREYDQQQMIQDERKRANFMSSFLHLK